jgi:uncharacterized membrane protein
VILEHSMAGSTVFALYAHTIMPGLHKTDDRTFVGAFQSIDRAIVNPWFMSTAFLDALVLTSAAAISNRGTPALPWIVAALALYLSAVLITMAVNVPLNDAVKAAGDPAEIDVAHVRPRRHSDSRLRHSRLGARPLRPRHRLVRRAMIPVDLGHDFSAHSRSASRSIRSSRS